MKNGFLKKISQGCLLCLLTAIAGCCVQINGCILPAKYERTVRLSAPLQPGSTFAAQTHNGSIIIEGADVTDCNLTATITARALTEEDAKKLAEETEITLEPSGNKLTVRIEKPSNMIKRSVSVSFDVIVPNRTNMELATHNGDVQISNITGDINGTTHNGDVKIANVAGQVTGTTHNGKITIEKIRGTIKLQTHNGSVNCEEISGDAQLRTHNGSIKACYSEAAPAVCEISLTTHNGSVDFKAPPSFSAVVEASTHNGSIKTELPITVTGEINKSNFTGIIGTGEGKLHLETHNGSIKIK
jgi:hypothetical protein